ncbi:SLIT3 [Mytilus coruscus]|uniref:SLIT3 n=1 Tax=Mytilus coruscus TaxID=42192 RepID=A0A6J8DA18_MYTCO|nr:SLIT3 [Mytilus coruscus]
MLYVTTLLLNCCIQVIRVAPCPEKCTCSSNTNQTHVTCKGRGLTEVPLEFPNNTYSMTLYENGITNIGANAFQNLSSLRNLDLNRNSIPVIENTTFVSLPNLSMLKLSYNRINEVKKDYFNGLANIQEIWMDENKLTFVEEGTFMNMNNLTVLSLDVHCDCSIYLFWNWLKLVGKYESTIQCFNIDGALLTSLPSCFFDKCNGK